MKSNGPDIRRRFREWRGELPKPEDKSDIFIFYLRALSVKVSGDYLACEFLTRCHTANSCRYVTPGASLADNVRDVELRRSQPRRLSSALKSVH